MLNRFIGCYTEENQMGFIKAERKCKESVEYYGLGSEGYGPHIVLLFGH